MNLRYIIVVIATVCINVNYAKFIAGNKKINSKILTISDLEGYMHRIAPKRKITFTNQDNLKKSRVARDTLLNIYRQQQMYNNVNKNLLNSYFNIDNNNKEQQFKKLNLNPYKDIHQQNRINDIDNTREKIYKKHSGFKVTDNVNHLKYLVNNKNANDNNSRENTNTIEPEPQPITNEPITNNSNLNTNDSNNLESTISNINKMDQATREQLIRKIIGSSNNGSDNIQDFSRQRRGEFIHNKLRSNTQMDRQAKLEILGSHLRSRSRSTLAVKCPGNNIRCINYYRKKNRMRRRSFS